MLSYVTDTSLGGFSSRTPWTHKSARPDLEHEQRRNAPCDHVSPGMYAPLSLLLLLLLLGL
jgi:hypothetical protein